MIKLGYQCGPRQSIKGRWKAKNRRCWLDVMRIAYISHESASGLCSAGSEFAHKAGGTSRHFQRKRSYLRATANPVLLDGNRDTPRDVSGNSRWRRTSSTNDAANFRDRSQRAEFTTACRIYRGRCSPQKSSGCEALAYYLDGRRRLIRAADVADDGAVEGPFQFIIFRVFDDSGTRRQRARSAKRLS